MKILKFRKFNWVVVRKKKYPSGQVTYLYRVYRKYFRKLIALSNTEKSYEISKERWEHLQKRLKENPDFHYNMELWSGVAR